MENQIKKVTTRLENQIHKTETGDLRNLLTDANILLQTLARNKEIK